MFLSKGYFASKNAMREVRASCSSSKNIVSVHEIDFEKGGVPLNLLMNECAASAREHVFGPADARKPIISWHRTVHFQMVAMKLIVRGMMTGCPEYACAAVPELFIPRELPSGQIDVARPEQLPAPKANWCLSM